jgi:hypothetical protein
MVASATVHEPPAWLRKHGTKASFAVHTLARGTWTKYEHVTDAFISGVDPESGQGTRRITRESAATRAGRPTAQPRVVNAVEQV